MVGFTAVASAVVGNLLSPPPAIPLGLNVAPWTSVPETAVHEDSDAVIG